MDIDTSVLFPVMSLFMLMAVGYIFAKFEILNVKAIPYLNKLAMYITMPSLVFISLATAPDSSTREVISVAGLGILYYVFIIGFVYLVPIILRVPKENKGIYQYLLMFSNAGFMGYPLIMAIFGDDALFYAVLLNMPFNLFAFSVGILFIVKGTDQKVNINYKQFLNLPIIATLIGLVFFAFKIPVHYVIADPLNMLGDMTTPLTMIIIGVSLSTTNIKVVFKDVRLYGLVLIKQIIIPLLLFVTFKAIGFDEWLVTIFAIQFATPAAAATVMVCEEYNGNTKLASEGVFFTTAMSVITIPIIATILM